MSDGIDLLTHILETRPKSLEEFETAIESLVSDLRGRGFLDETLRDVLPVDFGSRFLSLDFLLLKAVLTAPPRTWTCFVPVVMPQLGRFLPDRDGIALVPDDYLLGQKDSALIRVEVSAKDPRYAARVARLRVGSLISVTQVFARGGKADLGGNIVLVEEGGSRRPIDTSVVLRRERRPVSKEGMKYQFEKAWDGTQAERPDPLFDAIGNAHRAVTATDPETRFVLLWFGIERLVAGSGDYDTILSSAKALVPPSITISKIRSDVSTFSIDLQRFAKKNYRRQIVEATGHKNGQILIAGVIRFLIGDHDDSKSFTALFYDEPRLVQWYWKLRKGICGSGDTPSGSAISKYLEDSRQRVEWQILRLYRARNSLAHAGTGPAWLQDLTNHAHQYLTQLIAIVGHDRMRGDQSLPAEILLKRAAQYSVLLDLLRANDQGPITVEGLIDPAKMFRRGEEPT